MVEVGPNEIGVQATGKDQRAAPSCVRVFRRQSLESFRVTIQSWEHEVGGVKGDSSKSSFRNTEIRSTGAVIKKIVTKSRLRCPQTVSSSEMGDGRWIHRLTEVEPFLCRFQKRFPSVW